MKYKRGEYLIDRRTNKVWRVKDKRKDANGFIKVNLYSLVLHDKPYVHLFVSERELNSHFVQVGCPKLAEILFKG